MVSIPHSTFTPTPPHLYLYLLTSKIPPISSPPSFTPSIYSFLLSLSLYPLPPLPLPLSLPFHISTLFLSLCLLTFIPFYLCPLLLNPASLPLYPHLPFPLYPFIPFTPSFFYLSSPFYLSTPIPLSTPRHPSFCSLNLFILPSDRSLQPRTTLHRTVRRELCLEP